MIGMCSAQVIRSSSSACATDLERPDRSFAVCCKLKSQMSLVRKAILKSLIAFWSTGSGAFGNNGTLLSATVMLVGCGLSIKAVRWPISMKWSRSALKRLKRSLVHKISSKSSVVGESRNWYR